MKALELDVRFARQGFELAVRCAADQRVTGLIGRSGSGKTTLLHVISGLLRPDDGSIRINGRTVFDNVKSINLRPEQRGIGIVFQDSRLFPHLSVLRNLRYGRRRLSTTASRAPTFDHVVELLEIGSLLKRRPHELSGGERRRVALGRALLSGPDLLLLDEPLSALDDRLRSQVLPLLRRVRDECAVPMLYVCHDMRELLQMTASTIVLEAGRVAGCGAVRELAQQAGAFGSLHDLGLTNVLRCRVADSQPDDGVTQLEPAGDDDAMTRSEHPPVIRAPQVHRPGGAIVHVAIRPQDIALAQRPIENISIQNQLAGRVTNVSRHEDRVIVEIEIGWPLLVEITERARQQLSVAPGAAVCCLIKSTAIEHLS